MISAIISLHQTIDQLQNVADHSVLGVHYTTSMGRSLLIHISANKMLELVTRHPTIKHKADNLDFSIYTNVEKRQVLHHITFHLGDNVDLVSVINGEKKNPTKEEVLECLKKL